MNYYAEGRDPVLLPEIVQIFSRPSIYQANRTTDEGKIDAMSGTLELTLSPPITYLYVISSVPPPPNHVYIRERLGERFFISKMRAEDMDV